MKKLIFLLLLIPTLSFSQSKKYITPMAIFDVPLNYGLFDGLSVNAGALFGDEKFVQIGVLVGYRQYQTPSSRYEPVYSLGTFSFLWRVPLNKMLIIPMFSYANKTYQDLSLRLGYSINKEKTNFVHAFASTQMRFGVGVTIIVKK
jgi:hypothetical protein